MTLCPENRTMRPACRAIPWRHRARAPAGVTWAPGAYSHRVFDAAVQCSVNFTTKTTRINSSSVSARWFSGVGCSRNVELFGQAFLAESASKFDGMGNYYKGNMKTASSGRSSTTIKEKNPSLYIYSATNIYFPEKPSRGVIVVVPSANQPINSATRCGVVTSSSWGFGVHCDMYTNRF